MLTLLDSENADFDLTSTQTVLTHTPSTADAVQCMAFIALGDGAKDLDGSGGNFELTLSIGGQVCQPEAEVTVFGTSVQSALRIGPFPVPPSSQVLLKVKSPNAADTDVDVTAYLYGIDVAVYAARINFRRDQNNTRDEYSVVWVKNDTPITSGITVPKIQVIKRSDGTDLVALDTMSEVSGTHTWYYNESTNRQTLGESYLVHVQATIDGASRTWREFLGRDV